MKGYRLWFPDTKSPKFVISRDVTFDESALLNPRKEPVFSSYTYKTRSTSKWVELEVPSPPVMAETPAPEFVEEEPDVVEEAPLKEGRSIARDRRRREIRPPQRYVDIMLYQLEKKKILLASQLLTLKPFLLLIPPSGCFLCKKKLSLFIKTKLGYL